MIADAPSPSPSPSSPPSPPSSIRIGYPLFLLRHSATLRNSIDSQSCRAHLPFDVNRPPPTSLDHSSLVQERLALRHPCHPQALPGDSPSTEHLNLLHPLAHLPPLRMQTMQTGNAAMPASPTSRSSSVYEVKLPTSPNAHSQASSQHPAHDASRSTSPSNRLPSLPLP